MLCDTIKTILGNELTAQVEAALKGKGKDGKDVDVVVGNDGTFVPIEKYTGVQSQASKAESMVKAVADFLKGIGGSGDPAKLSEDVKAALGKIDTLNKEHQKEIEQIKKNTAVRLALAGKVHDPADVLPMLALDAIELDAAGGLKTDLDGMLKPIQEQKPYLFKVRQNGPADPPLKGAKPAEPGLPPAAPAGTGPTIF